MKIYVASSWRNNTQPAVVNALRADGHGVYDFRKPDESGRGFHWSDIDPYWKKWNFDSYCNGMEHPIAENGFGKDWDAMFESDACVLVLPCGRSAHLEAGWFVGMGRPVLAFIPDEMIEPELMYKMLDSIHCIIPTLLERLSIIDKSWWPSNMKKQS